MTHGLILKYLNKISTPEQMAQVEEWIADDADRSIEISRLHKIWSGLEGIQKYEQYSIESEWALFSEALEESQARSKEEEIRIVEEMPSEEIIISEDSPEESSYVDINDNNKSPSTNESPLSNTTAKSFSINQFIYAIAGILALALLVFLIFKILNPQSSTPLSTSYELEKYIELPGGGEVVLAPQSKFHLSEYDELTLELGNGQFDIPDQGDTVSIQLKDLFVATSGAEFSVNQKDDSVEFSTVRGQITIADKSDTANKLDLIGGESAIFQDGLFLKTRSAQDDEILAESTTDKDGTEISLSDLLDWLMINSDWKVASGNSMPLDENHVVTINLDQDYIAVLKELDQMINLEYINSSCKGCIVIRKMEAR